MDGKQACVHSGNYGRTTQGSGRTRSIVADAWAFRLTAATLLFVAALLAVPSVMALLKSWGVW